MAPHTISAQTADLLVTARETLRRDDVIAAIRASLRDRSGKSWSVTGGRGTAYGWIKVRSPKSRAADEWGTMTPAECADLATLLGRERVHAQGESIPSSHEYYRAYLDLAAGGSTSVDARPYWD